MHGQSHSWVGQSSQVLSKSVILDFRLTLTSYGHSLLRFALQNWFLVQKLISRCYLCQMIIFQKLATLHTIKNSQFLRFKHSTSIVNEKWFHKTKFQLYSLPFIIFSYRFAQCETRFRSFCHPLSTWLIKDLSCMFKSNKTAAKN